MVTLLIIISSAFLSPQPQGIASGNQQTMDIATPTGGEAKIRMENTDRMLKVKGLYIGPEATGLSYKLTVLKKGKSGTSNNSQSGKFDVMAGQGEVVLSSSGFGVQPEDKFNIELEIFQGADLISKDVLVYEAPAAK